VRLSLLYISMLQIERTLADTLSTTRQRSVLRYLGPWIAPRAAQVSSAPRALDSTPAGCGPSAGHWMCVALSASTTRPLYQRTHVLLMSHCWKHVVPKYLHICVAAFAETFFEMKLISNSCIKTTNKVLTSCFYEINH
jgi:hypothetical protein